VNFYQGPVCRSIHTDTKDTTTFASPITYSGGVIDHLTLESGRSITVFFETPSWPASAQKINGLVTKKGSSNKLLVAPNVYISDADSYLFMRGNSVYANGTPPDIHVMYSASLVDIKPLVGDSGRSGATNNFFIQPGDSFSIVSGRSTSNLQTVDGISSPTITAVRTKNGPYSAYIDFSVGIAAAGENAPNRPANPAWATNDLMFFDGGTASPLNLIKLGNQPSFKVVCTDKWEATLMYPVNTSYPAANKAGVIPPPDPSRFLITNKKSFSSIAVPFEASATSFAFEQDLDSSQGTTPFRCISFLDTTETVNNGFTVQLTIHQPH
jgi:hypothetical protein